MNKTFTVRLPWTTVEVTRRKTSRVTVRADRYGCVRASVPTRFSRAQAERCLRSLDPAAVEHLKEALPDERAADALAAYGRLDEGDTVQVWGRPRQVRHRQPPTGKRPRVVLEDDAVTFYLGTGSSGDGDLRRRLFEGLLRRELEKALPRARERAEGSVGVATGPWTVRRMTSRWGSCRYEKGRISINLDLATHDPACLETVAVHEVCHMVAHDHGPAFQELMDRCDPGWREVQHRLDEEGVRLPRTAPGR